MISNLLHETRNAGIFRLARIAAICIAFGFLVRHGFGPQTRALTMVGVATVLSLALVYELVSRQVSESVIAITLLGAWSVVASAYVGLQWTDPPKKQWQGPLLAGRENTPANGCDGKSELLTGDYLVMIFGTDGVVGHGGGPFTPVRVGTCPAVTFRHSGEGLRIDGFGYDGGNDVIYEIRDTNFRQILGGYLSAVRDEKNHLDIADDEGRPALQIEFLNSHAVRVMGTFRCGDTEPVIVGKTAVHIGKSIAPGHSCRVIEPGKPYAIEYAKNAGG
jgi:hypothetical protein